jgi:GR25 family glycosyltransferase involved in LPS biosynthesis
MNNLPPIYVINLKKSTDRLENVKKVMNKYNLKFNRFDAVYGKDLSQEEVNKNANILCRTLLCNNGMIGCTMSHIKLWKQLLEDKNNDTYLILEDDIEDINIEQLNSLFNFINETKFDYDYINLNCISMFCQNLNKGIKVNDKLYLTNKLFSMGAAAYIINKSGAKKLVDMFNKYKIIYYNDISVTFKKYLSLNNFKQYNTNYNIIILNEETTVNSTITKTHNSIILVLLHKLKLYEIEWNLRVSLFTLFRKIQISFYFCILVAILVLNIKKLKIKYLNYFIILELVLLILTQ